jgi:hypothetical protein
MHPHDSQIVRIASRRAASFGAASLTEVAASASDRALHVSGADARAALAHSSTAEFLDDDWFWLPGADRNRLWTLSRRILAVASPLDVATIWAGVCRTYSRRQAAFVPPAEVMGAFYAAHSGFAVDAPGRVRSSKELEYRTELGRSDRIFVDVLRSSWTGVLDPASFRDACFACGMAPRTFVVRSVRSAVLDHPATDIWCLRGTRVSALTGAALRHARVAGDGRGLE